MIVLYSNITQHLTCRSSPYIHYMGQPHTQRQGGQGRRHADTPRDTPVHVHLAGTQIQLTPAQESDLWWGKSMLSKMQDYLPSDNEYLLKGKRMIVIDFSLYIFLITVLTCLSLSFSLNS